MEKKGLILVAIIVIGLALGPLTYFSGTGQGEDRFEPGNKTVNQSDNFYAVSSNFTGEITDLDPYIYFEGIKGSNNITKAKKEFSEVLPNVENYSIDLELAEQGWRYDFRVPVNNVSEASRIGYKMDLILSLFYSESRNPYRVGKVELPSNIIGKRKNGEYINVSAENEQLNSTFIYSQPIDSAVVSCPHLITALNGELVRSLSICSQTKKSLFRKADPEDLEEMSYIVTKDHFERADGETFEKNYTLEVLGIRNYEVKYLYEKNKLSKEKIKELPAKFQPKRISNQSISLIARTKNRTALNKTIEYLEEQNLTRIDAPRAIALLKIPGNVTFGNETYTIKRKELITADSVVPIDTNSGEKLKFKVKFGVLYGEVFAVPEAKYVGSPVENSSG